jgi:putative transposase
VGVGQRTIQRWRERPDLSDGRKGPTTKPHNKLSDEEIKQMISTATSIEFINKSPHQIVPLLADRGEFIASESSFYRVMKSNALLTHRGSVKPKTMVRPKAFEAMRPNELYSWDITYLRSSLRGQYFYLYMFLDIFSRKIVGWRVHDRESAELSSALLNEICLKEKIDKDTLVLHSDNGGPMKGATMLVTLQKLGIVPSFSRPSVSDDNAFSESTFRTLKHCPQYPTKPFESLMAATAWVELFVVWYNTEHLHSGISFVTPSSRHEGRDVAILANRKLVYTEARRKHPSRWSKDIRNWNRIDSVKLNSLKEENKNDTTEISRLVS